MKTRELVFGGILAGLLFAMKMAMAGLPNIEPVTLFLILYTLSFPRITPLILAVYIILEGLFFGFGVWWISYLYIWPLLALGAWLMRRNTLTIIWAVYAAAFGLFFGTLTAIPWLFTHGPRVAAAYIISGIPFDLAHCFGNLILALLLFRPINHFFKKLSNQL